MEKVVINKIRQVVRDGICTGCGACIALDADPSSKMEDTAFGPVPKFSENSDLLPWSLDACPGAGVNYPSLYLKHFGHYPERWLIGEINKVRTGYASDPEIRKIGASGGVLTRTLIYLLETNKVDAVILAKQGCPKPENARAVIVRSREEILECAQSIYIPVSMLDILRNLDPGKKYAITCLPEQSAALRKMQCEGFGPAQRIEYIIGPYTGTALYPSAIRCFLRSKGIKSDDPITSLRWREGNWPGYLQICTASGRVVKTKKVYYNFLIPFFVTQTSLQSMDMANEFADLAVGDAWSPVFESQGGGHAIVVTRNEKMESVISEMSELGLLKLDEEDPLKASEMHGHMLDFKKRGGFLRNRWRQITGRRAPDYGYQPESVPLIRVLVEIVISTIFAIGRTSLARGFVSRIPESIIGPLFNRLRLGWKSLSKPTKRKGLEDFKVRILDAK